MRYTDQAGNWSEVTTDTPILGKIFDDAVGSDKSVTVPTNETWHLNFVQIVLTSTAVVGNRLMSIAVTDSGGDLVLTINASVNQVASLVRTYTGFQGQFRETAFVNNEIRHPIPTDFYLQSGSVIRFYDTAAIDVVSDTMVISGSYKKYPGWRAV
jgi:hypothetical protein